LTPPWWQTQFVTFLFVSVSFTQWGGVETLSARMAGWLLDQGHQVLYMAKADNPAKCLFDERVEFVTLTEDFERLKWKGKRFARKICREHLGSRKIDVLIAFTPYALWVGAGLLNGLGYPVALLAGVWGPKAYVETGLIGLLRDPGSHLFRTQLAPESRSFMSREVKTAVEQTSRKSVDGFIWPIPVDGKRYVGIQRQPERGLIVSVGRIEDMKYYNRQALQITKELLVKGYDVHWDIYGDGSEKSLIETQIKEAGFQDRIRLRGAIEYHKLPEVLAKAQVFVGMGTSLIEAGFCRVPGVCAVIYNPNPTTHGCLHEMPGFVCGDHLSQPLTSISDAIARLMDLSPAEYALTEKKTREHVQRYELDPLMTGFMDRVAQIPKVKRIWRPGWIYLAGRLAFHIWNGPLRPLVSASRMIRNGGSGVKHFDQKRESME
jgi:glycosyltransferase involved in cell wall biosynthesis